MTLRMLVLSALALLLGACPSEESQCRAACIGSITVSLVPPLTEQGTYEFELHADAWSTSCQIAYGEEVPPYFEVGNSQCETQYAHLSADSASPWAVDTVVIDQYAPKKVTVRITRDGKVIRERTFMPTYEFNDVCGKRCAAAELEL